MRWPTYLVISAAVLSGGASCGVDAGVFGNSGGGTGDGGSGATGGTTSTTGGNGGSGGTSTTGGGGIGGDGGGGGTTCDPFVEEVSMRPLDMILTIDHSGSAGALWPSLQAEIEVFATTPRPAGTQLAFNMSPDGGNDNNACNVDNYEPPDFGYAAIPDNGTAAGTELTSWGVANGGSPMVQPIEGMLTAAVNRQNANPRHVGVAVYMMDSVVSLCGSDDNKLAQILSSALSVAGIHTYAIQIEGPAQGPDLSLVASAGGTGTPIDLSAPGSITQLHGQLDQIRAASIPCELPLPELPMGASPDPEDWSLEFTPSGGMTTVVPRVANEAACGGSAGWYFDNADVVKLCGATCTSIKTDANPKTEMLFDCAP